MLGHGYFGVGYNERERGLSKSERVGFASFGSTRLRSYVRNCLGFRTTVVWQAPRVALLKVRPPAPKTIGAMVSKITEVRIVWPVQTATGSAEFQHNFPFRIFMQSDHFGMTLRY